MATVEEQSTKVKTGKVRLSYVAFLTPKPNKNGKLKYGCAVLVKKDDKETRKTINAAIQAAIQKGVDKYGKKFPTELEDMRNPPLRDGDKDKTHRDDPNYNGCLFLNASSDTKPGVIDKAKNELDSPEDVYSGMYARVTLNFFPYDADGTMGVGVGLNNVQKLGEGPRLAGKASADADFDDDFEDDEDDDLL